MNWVYIIRCEDGSYYTGWSTDPVHRFHVHKAGKGAKYTRSHHPIALVYAQCYDTKKKAMAQEYAVKQKTHKEKEKLMESMPDDVEQYVRTLERRRKFMEELKIYRCRKCGKIVIKSTVKEVVAIAGSECENNIGAGLGGTCGEITIEDKTKISAE